MVKKLSIENPSLEQVDKFLAGTRGRGLMTTKLLGKFNPFIQAVSSELGQQLLQDDIDRHEELLFRWYDEEKELSIPEKAELSYLKKRLKKISERIMTYSSEVKKITNYKGENDGR